MIRCVRLGTLCAVLSLGCIYSGSASADTQPPTTPTNFKFVIQSPTSVTLTWDAATDNRRVKSYIIRRDGEKVAVTRKLSTTDYSLTPSTEYVFTLTASDGTNESAPVHTTVTTPFYTADSGNSTPGKARGKKDGDVVDSDPASDDPDGSEPTPTEPVEEPVSEPEPDQPTGDVASVIPSGWQLRMSDEFDGSGALDVSSDNKNWRFETMDDALHRAGNSGIDAYGNETAQWESVRGKRWSGWYNAHHAQTHYRENGNLVMGGFDSGEIDLTRPIDYMDNGVWTQYGSSKLYASWIDTWSRKWVGPGDLHVTDPQSPSRLFKYGYFEMRVNFSEVKTPGFRISAWLMPGSTDAEGQNLIVNSAYDNDGDNGVEIDMFEYEWAGPGLDNTLQLSIHGGSAGSSATNFDATSIGVDMRSGYHVIGLLWTADRIAWYIDGKLAKEETDASLIPDVYSYFIISREMNSGVKRPDSDYVDSSDVLEDLPYRPRDPGLYAKNIWEFRNSINTDRALIDYVRIYQP